MTKSRFASILALVFAVSPPLILADKPPETFEQHLREHPKDESRREQALVWYNRRSRNFDRLREHTIAMIEHHPSNMHIYFENVRELLARPEYHAELVQLLETRVKKEPSSGACWVLALTCEERATPPDLSTDAKKRRFLAYYGLDSDAGLPKQIDQELVAKTIQYFKKAIELASENQSRHGKDAELAESDRWSQNFYARQLLNFYSSLGRHAEAIELCRTTAQRKENLSDPDFLLAYGESLFAAGRLDEAKQWLIQVRSNDHEGFEDGPAHATVEAETTLGLIALERGDINKAVEHLDASTKVQKCCHNTTKGFPTVLASKILDNGKTAPVVQFCETVLRNFTPDQDYLKALMERAKAAEQKQIKP